MISLYNLLELVRDQFLYKKISFYINNMNYEERRQMIKNKLTNRELFEKSVNSCQLEYSNTIYPEKKSTDKITCLICGGQYSRSVKSVHDKRKKHIKCLDEIYDYIFQK